VVSHYNGSLEWKSGGQHRETTGDISDNKKSREKPSAKNLPRDTRGGCGGINGRARSFL